MGKFKKLIYTIPFNTDTGMSAIWKYHLSVQLQESFAMNRKKSCSIPRGEDEVPRSGEK